MITEWVSRNTTPDSLLVAVCEGVRVLAAGLLHDRSASSHFFALGQLDRDYPETQWIRGVRWVEDGNLITSAGVTASIDATFHALRRVAGLEVAQRTARDVGYEMELHPREVDPFNFETSDFLSLFMTAGFLWNKTDVGVALYEGIDEIELGAILDLYPRVLDGSAWTVAPVREPIRSRNGLDLVAWSNFDESPDFDAVLIPEFLKAPPAEAERAVVEWSNNQNIQVRRFNETIAGAASGGFPYEAALLDIAQRRSKAVARGVAKTVEYPLTHLTLRGSEWPFHLFAIPLGFGLLGFGFAGWWVRKRPLNLET